MTISFLQKIAACTMTMLACTSTGAISSASAADFGGRYTIEDDAAFDYRPMRRHVEVDDEEGAPRLERRIVERRVLQPVVERRIVEREIVQPVVERTVVRRVVQPVVERRVVYRPPVDRKVVIVQRPFMKSAHFVHRPWHERRSCFLPERYLCG